MIKYKRILIVMCGFGIFLFAQETYPVYALHTKDSTWFDNIDKIVLG